MKWWTRLPVLHDLMILKRHLLQMEQQAETQRAALSTLTRQLDVLRQEIQPPFSTIRGEGRTAVIVNGVPKSGTSLLREVVKALGPWVGTDVLLNRRNFDAKDSKQRVLGRGRLGACEQLRLTRNGQIFSAHLPFQTAVAEEMALVRPDRTLRHLLIVRDPREVLVRRLQTQDGPVSSSSTDEVQAQRLAMVQDHVQDFLSYLPWLDEPTCLVVRYEDIMAELDRAATGPGPTLNRLAKFLDYPTEGNVAWAEVGARVRQENLSVFQENQAIRERPFEHQAYFQTPAIRDGLARLGYPEI
jgi:hypothetical protein